MSDKNVGSRTFNASDAKESRAASVKVVKEATTSKLAARQYLEKLGTHKSNGELTKRYGGK